MAFRNAQQAAVNNAGDYEDVDYDDDEEYVEEDDDEEVETDEDDEEYDGQIEEVEEDSEEEQQQFVARGAGTRAGTSGAAGTAWSGIASLPEPTQRSFHELLQQLKKDNRHDMTVLLLGKSMMGKSSTVNSLFNESVAPVTSFQQDTARPQIFQRTAAGFEMSVIDTPGLLDSDAVSTAALKSIAQFLKDKKVDVVLYLDRLDFYRVDKTDQEIMTAITNTLGQKIWRNTIIGLTHGKAIPPQGFFTDKQEDYAETRVSTLRKAMRAAGAQKDASLPVAFIENSSHCSTNAAGEKVIGPNKDRRWLPELMAQPCGVPVVQEGKGQWCWIQLCPSSSNGKISKECGCQIVSIAQSVPAFKWNPKDSKKRNPNKRRRWLIPLFIVAQVALKKYVIDRVLEDDGATGDQYGPYAPEHIKEERERLKKQKAHVKAKREAEKEKLGQQASKKKNQARSQISAAADKAKRSVQQALPTADSDDSSSDDSSSDSD